jgi:hypothetical protein
MVAFRKEFRNTSEDSGDYQVTAYNSLQLISLAAFIIISMASL